MGLGVDRFGTDSGKHAKLSGKRTDHIIWSVNCHTDDGNVLLTVRDSHSSHNIFGIHGKKMIQFLYRVLLFHDNAD